MSTRNESKRLKGAKKLMLKGIELNRSGSLVILANENRLRVVEYLVQAAKMLGIKNLMLVQIPEVLRPVVNVPPALSASLNEIDALIYVADRMPEEDFRFNRVLTEICWYREHLRGQPTKYCMMSNAKPQYLEEGIAGDYAVVKSKCQKIAELLRESKKVEITSITGTSISFSLYKDILPRAPSYSYTFSSDKSRFLPYLQAPEGEVMGCPIEDTFTGKLVVDGPVSGVATSSSPITWTFERGQSVKVDGDEEFLSKLKGVLRRADSRVRSLRGIWIAEFSIGANDWAILDDNFSNCEKVAGTFHVGMGHTECQIGIERGEQFHFDSVIVNSNVTVTKHNDEKVELIRSGKLLI